MSAAGAAAAAGGGRGEDGLAGAGGGGSGAVTIDGSLFWSRLSTLVESWESGARVWAGAAASDASAASAVSSASPVDALLVLTGPAESEDTYSRLSALQLWLFGYEIPDSALLLASAAGVGAAAGTAEVRLSVLSSAKKCKILQSLATHPSRPPRLSLALLESSKADRNVANVDRLLAAASASRAGKRIGQLRPKAAGPPSSLSASLLQRLADAAVEVVDVSVAVGLCLCVHDAAARRSLALASELSTRVMKRFAVAEMETLIDEEKAEAQIDLADRVEDAIRNPQRLGITALGGATPGGAGGEEVKLSVDDVDSCYTPIIQSGGEGEGSDYDLRVSAQSSALPLQYSSETAIIVQMGARYRNLCSNIGRTYFINPSAEQKDVYLLLTQIYITAKQNIKPGNKIQNIMLNARRVIAQSKHADLLPKFTKSCGFGIGLEFRDAHLLLTDKNPRLIQPHMAFNLAIGFTDLVTAAGHKYAVYLADTVLVKEAPPADSSDAAAAATCESLTKMPREYKDITYLIGGDGAEDGAGDGGGEGDAFVSGARATRGSAARVEEDASGSAAAEKVRAAHQAELARRQREVAMKKLAAENAENQFHGGMDDAARALQAYPSPAAFPPSAKKDRIFVDMAAEALLLPIYDQLVPFHINTVKNVHRQEEGTHTSLRITFFTPDAKLSAAQQQLGIGNPAAAAAAGGSGASPASASASASLLRYISELTFRTASQSLDKVFFDIKELRKRVQNRLKEFEAKSSLVVQADLVLDKKGPIPTLKEVSARPQLSRKKTTGTLMAHVNGLRYSTTDKFKVDLLYSNIKAAFYQPAEDTHQVLLHFELRHPILLDRSKTKKTSFLQIYYEVVDASEDINSSSRYRDEDGLMEEQQERVRRKRWNERFLQWVKETEKKLAASTDPQQQQHRLEFDIPYRELAFTGVPAKSSVDIMPTVHALVALDDTPPLVLPLGEVEIAVFERVQFGLRNFDLVFVYRDFARMPMRIDSIPMRFLEPIKALAELVRHCVLREQPEPAVEGGDEAHQQRRGGVLEDGRVELPRRGRRRAGGGRRRRRGGRGGGRRRWGGGGVGERVRAELGGGGGGRQRGVRNAQRGGGRGRGRRGRGRGGQRGGRGLGRAREQSKEQRQTTPRQAEGKGRARLQ